MSLIPRTQLGYLWHDRVDATSDRLSSVSVQWEVVA